MSATDPQYRRAAWEVLLLQVCISAVVLVVTVCVIIFVIYATKFGVAQLQEHTP